MNDREIKILIFVSVWEDWVVLGEVVFLVSCEWFYLFI